MANVISRRNTLGSDTRGRRELLRRHSHSRDR